ncbi:MAG: class I SAM-dependent methyltransferase [Alphaproteobacteria bacterium]|nr:class I SAM-dependent methyltransferase [Alphaproteobacteria bacterium SS10]
MSEFSTEWLDLRAPADQAARSLPVLEAVRHFFTDRERISVTDLGAGTGATLRGVAPYLPAHQSWVLVDQDQAHLDVAANRTAAWQSGGAVAASIELSMRTADLVSEPTPWSADTDFVTASALFDLVSAAWLDQFIGALTASGKPLLALLTYDGRLGFEPAHPGDQVLIDAFNQHQQTDKGFGPALGPNAARYLSDRLTDAGYRLVEGDSTWHLDPGFTQMRHEMITGWAGVATEMGVEAQVIDAWREAHWTADDLLSVGHTDLFAYPA